MPLDVVPSTGMPLHEEPPGVLPAVRNLLSHANLAGHANLHGAFRHARVLLYPWPPRTTLKKAARKREGIWG